MSVHSVAELERNSWAGQAKRDQFFFGSKPYLRHWLLLKNCVPMAVEIYKIEE
jgi:hypothetical protein